MRAGDLIGPSEGPGSEGRLPMAFPGTLEEGGPGFILKFPIKVHGNLGHDKAQSHFIYFSPSTMPNWAILETYGKVRLRRIQRRRLQDVWWRTHGCRQVLLKDQLIHLDKDY